jgi:hypothetical protein
VISALVRDSSKSDPINGPWIGVLVLGHDGTISVLHSYGDDLEVVKYARGGDYSPLATRLHFQDATPEMLEVAADVLADKLARGRRRPRSAQTRRNQLLIAASVALLMHTGRSRKDALFLTGRAFKCKPRKIEAAIKDVGFSVSVLVLQKTAELAAADTTK